MDTMTKFAQFWGILHRFAFFCLVLTGSAFLVVTGKFALSYKVLIVFIGITMASNLLAGTTMIWLHGRKQ